MLRSHAFTHAALTLSGRGIQRLRRFRLNASRFSLLGLAFLGCAAQAPPASTPPRVGLANPASVFCVARGGRLDIRTTPAGQVGICIFPDGREIEEWAFWRANHPSPGPAAK